MRFPRLLVASLSLLAVLYPAISRADLISYWDFSSSSALGTDKGPKGNTIKPYNTNTAYYTASGKNGGGLQLTGSSSYLLSANGISAALNGLPTGNSPYTVSVWVKSNQSSNNGSRGIYSWGSYNAFTNNTLRFDTSNGNGLDHYWRNSDLIASGSAVSNAGASLVGGTWVHVATRYDGATRAIYVNGTLAASDVPGVNGATNTNFTVGTTDNGTYFTGTLDDLAIWNTALPVEQIANLANNSITPLNGPKITAFQVSKTSGFENDPAQISWTIDATNSKAQSTTYTITQGTNTIYSSSVAQGAPSSGFSSIKLPTVGGNSAQVVTYTLAVTDSGTSGSSVTTSSTFNVTVSPDVPVATPQSGLVATTQSIPITLAATDPAGAALTYSIVTPPAHGTISGGTYPARTYTPTAGYSGLDSFTFKANNGAHDSATALVSIAVVPTPSTPTALALNNTQLNAGLTSGGYVGDFSTTDANPGVPHSYSLVTGTGNTDNARFTVSGRQLRAAQSIPAGSYSIRVRSTSATGQTIENVFVLTAAAPAAGKVVINEILYNGQSNVVFDNFIELYNNTGAPVDLSGWQLTDAVSYVFPAGTTLATNGYVVVAADPATIQSIWGVNALGPYAGNLSSSGETVNLRNAGGTVVCSVDYTPRFPWPAAADGEGASMELINPNLDPSLGSSWRSSIFPAKTSDYDVASPGARNFQYAANAAPAVRQVSATPTQPTENTPVTISAKVTDPDGVASVQLQYQIVAPGNFIPSTLANPIVNHLIVGADYPLPANPAFEAAANWITVPMNDAGVNGDLQDGDGIYTATIPGQANRTLVRYRIVVADNPGNSIRTPYVDDPSLNFAYFVYNGVPDYQGVPAATLTQLPNYHFLTRAQDYTQCVAYDNANQLYGNTSSWTYENWEAAIVYDGTVYDHVLYRLHGANGRYYYTSKRAFRWFFNKGYEFQAKDNDGNLFPTTWRHIVTENLWENRGTLTYSLNEMVNFYLFHQVGIPSPYATMINFRLLDNAAEQPDAYHGDYWGLMMVHEDYEKNFLDAHKLDKGNLYKLTRDDVDGTSQQRYQAPYAVSDGSDHDAIYNDYGATHLTGYSTPAYVTSHVNMAKYDYYHALAEAIRHYDYWSTGDNNGAYYFDPATYTADNSYHGQLWILPSDTDATWGPTWNQGHDVVHNALFNDSGDGTGDSGTNPTLWTDYFNALREVRDILWQSDQINPVIDQFAAIILPQQQADNLRWKNAPNDAGNYNGLGGAGITSIANLAQDMKNFAFVGGSWPPYGTEGSVPSGGRGAVLDTLQRGVLSNGVYSEDTIPATPTISAAGAANYPINDLRFNTTAFAGKNGNTFAAIQWRVAEVTDTTAPAYVAGQKALLEWNASYDSGAITTFASQFRFPASGAKAGHTYRARVRHKDSAGRWSHWSAPVQFTATAADVSGYQNSLVISEFLYYPAVPSGTAEAAFQQDDFQFLEVTNVSSAPVDLSDVRITKGVNFDFPAGLSLAPGASTVVVANTAAFAARYGSNRPVAGAWTTSLAHKGEEVKLSYGSGQTIIDFTYSNVAPWPVVGTAGYSLVLVNPYTLPDPTNPANWRKSYVPGGNPGGADTLTYAWWASAYPGAAGNPNASMTGNGMNNLLVYALGGNPTVNNIGLLPKQSVQSLNVNGTTGNYLTLTLRHQGDSTDITYHVEFSTNMATWTENGALVSNVTNGDGTYTQTWRSANPVSASTSQFVRLRVTAP